jgi:hypothetical protein
MLFPLAPFSLAVGAPEWRFSPTFPWSMPGCGGNREQAVVFSVVDGMNACVDNQRINIRKKRIQK